MVYGNLINLRDRFESSIVCTSIKYECFKNGSLTPEICRFGSGKLVTCKNLRKLYMYEIERIGIPRKKMRQ